MVGLGIEFKDSYRENESEWTEGCGPSFCLGGMPKKAFEFFNPKVTGEGRLQV